MEIATCGNGFREDNPSGIHRLPNSLQMTTSSNLPDENRSESFRAKFFVNAKEIYLHSRKSVVSKAERYRDPRDECAELALLVVGSSQTDVPPFLVVWRQ